MTRRWSRELLAVVGQTAALGGLAVGMWQFFGRDVSVWPTFGLAAVVVVAAHVQRRLRERTEVPRPPSEDDRFDRPFARIGVLRQQLETGLESADRFDRVLRPALVSIIEEQLRRCHNVEMARNPEQGRHLLGEELWPLIQGPPGVAPTLRDLERVVERIERL